MNELLKKLFEAEVLSEETRNELETAIKAQLDEATAAAREEATASVTAELHEQWISERTTLIEALDSKVTEFLTSELAELHESIESFRDLEAEYAVKIVEAKSEMATVLKNDVAELIEKLDTFLETRLTSELEELRENIDEVRKNEFGKSVFEAFVSEFKKHYAGDDSVEGKLSEAEQRLEDALTALEEAEKKAGKLERTIKLEKVLAPVQGRAREVMEAILKNVDTSMLEEAYKTYIGRVLKESAEPTAGTTSEKESKVLAEEKKTETVKGVVKSGDTAAEDNKLVVESAATKPSLDAQARANLRRVAGIA